MAKRKTPGLKKGRPDSLSKGVSAKGTPSRPAHRHAQDAKGERTESLPRESIARRPSQSREARSSREDSVALYGRHAVLAALANPRRRHQRLIVSPAHKEALAPLVEAACAKGGHRIAPQIEEKAFLDHLAGPEAVHQGIVLLSAPAPLAPIEDLLKAGRPTLQSRRILVALDQVTDPQNVGAILRSAAAFGACGLIVTERHGAGESGALARAASGALELVPRYGATNLVRALEQLKDAGWWVTGLAEEGLAELGSWTPPDDLVLVLGAEGSGLRRLTRKSCDVLLRLPTDPALPSLNVSNAAAVALFALSTDRQ